MANGRVVPRATARGAPLGGCARDGRPAATTSAGRAGVAVGELVIRDIGEGVVGVLGELDWATGPRLHGRLDEDRSVKILDLRGVSFIDAGGLEPLVAAVRARGTDDTITLRAPSRCVRRLLELTGLIRHVIIESPSVFGNGPDPADVE